MDKSGSAEASAVLTLQQAEDLAFQALVAAGTDACNARPVARALVAAEASGQPGHGLSRIPSYTQQVRAGKVDGAARPQTDRVRPGVVRIDAGHGFAYPAIDLALDLLPGMARENGIALAAIHRSHHFGQAGLHCEALAEKGLVTMIFGNAPKSIAPWGASRAMFGTNPVAFAAPGPAGAAPLVIDFAVSRVAKGKIMAAERTGTAIPEGWALDENGAPTTDAGAAIKGTMVPIGEAKGAALAMMIEVLSAALVGGSYGFEASSLFDGEGGPPNLAQTIIAINPGPVSGDGYSARIALLFEEMAATAGARMPGTRRLEARERARTAGISLPDQIYADLIRLAAEGSV